MDAQMIDVGGCSLCVWCSGDLRQPDPLVLLHSLGESARTWSGVVDHWSVSRPVYALDLRGHGASGRSAAYSFEQMRGDVAEVLEQLGLENVTIVGHSLGGIVGYLLASKGTQRLDRLVLEEAPPPLPVIPPREVPADPGGDTGFDWRALSDLYAERNDPDPSWWDDLERIDIPVLVIAGGDRSHVDQSEIADMTARIPDANLVTIESGHNVHASEPDAFREAIDRFLARG